MRTRTFVITLAALLALPAVGTAAQRMGRFERFASGLRPSQVWRVTSLSLEQRRKLHDLQMSAFRDLRDAQGGGRDGRRALFERMRELQSEMERVVTPAQLAEARSLPSGPLAPEELLYYPITSLRDLDPSRRAKIDAVFRPVVEEAREEMAREGGWGQRGQQGEPGKQGENRQKRIAYYEVLDALLTTEQMATVNGFLPDQVRKIGLKERVVYRLPSLTLEQEAEARAIFAALEDETGADRARVKAINSELRSKEASRDQKQTLLQERREIQTRLDARERVAYAQLERALGPEQMKELEGQRPGPPRPLVFRPESIRQLSLSAEQQRVLGQAFASFQMETREERREMRELRGKVQGSDIQSLEMAETRDKLRNAAAMLDVERERITRTIADTLTAEQIVQLLEIGMQGRKER